MKEQNPNLWRAIVLSIIAIILALIGIVLGVIAIA